MESTCCYGARTSSPRPPGPPRMAASLPVPHPALVLAGLGWNTEPSAGLAMVCPTVGVLLTALCPLLPQTGLGVTPNLPAFLSRPPGAMWGWGDASGWRLPSHHGLQHMLKPLGNVGAGSSSISWLGLGKAGPIPAHYGARGDSQLASLHSP